MNTEETPIEGPLSNSENSPISNSSSAINAKTIVASLLGLLAGVLVAFYILEYLPGGTTVVLFAFTVSFFLVILLGLLALWARNWLFRKIFTTSGDADSLLMEAQQAVNLIVGGLINKTLSGLPTKQVELAKTYGPKAVSYFIWGRLRRWWINFLFGIILGIGGLATTVLLANQNKLLEVQNRKIDTQNALIEGQRRSSLILLMSNILTDVSTEINNQSNASSDDRNRSLDSIYSYALSRQLVARIASLAQGLLPYQILEKGEMSKEEYSPERAQLLLALLGSQLNLNTYTAIFDQTNFEAAYLVKANLRNAYLSGANLEDANLMRANLLGAHLGKARLKGTVFSNAELHFSNMSGANLEDANFSSARLDGVNLSEAILDGANLSNAICEDANLSDAFLLNANVHHVDFQDAQLVRINAAGSDFSESDFSRADLHDAKFQNADLTTTRFINANLSYVDFHNAELSGARFDNANLVCANFSGTPLTFVTLRNADLSETNLAGIIFWGTDFRGANLAGANLRGADLRLCENLTVEQLLSCSSIKEAKGIDDWIEELKKEKPCLFTYSGCD